MSSGKKLILEHFRKEGDTLKDIESKIAKLETATKQKLQEFSDSSKKSRLYAERPYDLSGVKRNLFETTLKHMNQTNDSPLFSDSPFINEPPRKTKENNLGGSVESDELRKLQKENSRLKQRLNQSQTAKLEEQLDLLAMVQSLQTALRHYTKRKLHPKKSLT